MAPCARVRVGHARQEEDSLAEREGEKMSRFFVAILMAVLIWSTGSVANAAEVEVKCPEKPEHQPDQPMVIGHEVLDFYDSDFGRAEVKFNLQGFVPNGRIYFRGLVPEKVLDRQFVPGNTTYFRGWMPAVLLDRQCQENPPAIKKSVGIYFHSDGLDGRFQIESLRLLHYLEKNQKPNELLIAISRPAGFDRTQVNHGKEIEAQARLIDYLTETFSLGENVELYGHGAETVAIALTVHPTVRKVTAFPRTLHEEGQGSYYYLLAQRIEKLLPDDSDLKIDLAYNPYDSGQEEVRAFVTRLKAMGLQVTTSEVTKGQVVSDGSIPQKTLDKINEQVLIFYAFIKEYLGLTFKVEVYVSRNPNWMADRYLEAFELDEGFRPGKVRSFSRCEPAGEGGFYAIFIPVCNNRGLSAEQLENLVVHEVWHAVQYYLLNSHCCIDNYGMQHVGPDWLFEGTAEVLSLLVATDFDVDYVEKEMARLRGVLRKKIPADFNLLSMNTRIGRRRNPVEALQLAGLMLMSTAGLQSFLDFYGNLGDYYAAETSEDGFRISDGYDGWFSSTFFDSPERLERLDEIFQAAFGRTMEEFAKEFRDSLR